MAQDGTLNSVIARPMLVAKCPSTSFRHFFRPTLTEQPIGASVSVNSSCEEIAVVQAFRPAVSGGPEGPHYIRAISSQGQQG